jgi:MinD-like ATPase involved in chromosome partitioning or flagellar assembly
MLVTCWSVKGGSGTTVVAAALALTFSRLAPSGALLVDLAGDAPAALGVGDPATPGVGEWLDSPTASDPDVLESLTVPVDDRLRLLHRGSTPTPDARWIALARHLSARRGVTVVDAGLAPVPKVLLDASDESLLVVRPCYLALRRAMSLTARPSGVILVAEPGRAFGADDVQSILRAPVRATVGFDPLIARAVDAGLLATRLPHTLSQALRGAA